jgi:hypothetical protein
MSLLVSKADPEAAAGRYDPLQSETLLPLETEYFPLGYRLRIASNSELIHLVAGRIWSRYPCLSDEPAIRLNIAVTADDAGLPPPAALFRAREHLFSIVADRHNFATADLRLGTGFASFAENLSGEYLRYQFLEPLAYVLIAARYLTFTHAACVALEGRGMLLAGDSGAGKTCLAFACARKGWTFLSGDATAIVRGRTDHRVLGRPFEIRFRETARQLFPELDNYPRVIRPNGKDDIEIDPRDLGLKSAIEGTVSHVVLLERSPYPVPAVADVLPKDEALRHLEQAICFGDESSRTEQFHSLREFLALPIHRLRFYDLNSAERVLRSLIMGRR